MRNNIDIIKACDIALSKMNKVKRNIYLTDKFSRDYVSHKNEIPLKTHGYESLYNLYLNQLNFTPQISVELGSCLGSALVFKSLFETRQLSLDIRNKDEIKYEIEFYNFDEKTEESYFKLTKILSGQCIDFFVDDALHDRNSQKFALDRISNIMNNGGLYVVEESRLESEDIESIKSIKNFKTYDIRNETNYCNSIITFIQFA